MAQNLKEDRNCYEEDPGNIHSFIVRVWREETGFDKGQIVWRGHITPLPGEQRYYFSKVSEIPGLLLAHLKDQG
ncbi:MAG: hypothetical protein ABIJ39_03710 [Chloroflexota bacterium]